MHNEIRITGSKSILQRMMALAAHSRCGIKLLNYNPCADVLEMEHALLTFGFHILRDADSASFQFDPELHRKSNHDYRFTASATAFRLWLSVLANQPKLHSRIVLSSALLHRGYKPLEVALTGMGASITQMDATLEIIGSHLAGGAGVLCGNFSSQFHSSLILAAPFMQTPLRLQINPDQVSKPYIDLSLNLIRMFGASIQQVQDGICISCTNWDLPEEFWVDADISTAAFYAVKGALCPGGIRLKLKLNPSLPQADAIVFDHLAQMGARVAWDGDICTVLPGSLRGADICLKDAPDLMPVLSILALFCEGRTRLGGIGRLIHKESDRVAGICWAFDLLGVTYRRDADSLTIHPLDPDNVAPVVLDTQQDHRLVMAFSLLKCRFPQISLSETASIAKSLPFSSFHPVLAAPGE